MLRIRGSTVMRARPSVTGPPCPRIVTHPADNLRRSWGMRRGTDVLASSEHREGTEQSPGQRTEQRTEQRPEQSPGQGTGQGPEDRAAKGLSQIGESGLRQEQADSHRPMRVLLVSARFPPSIGGTEIHTAEVARRFAARGIEVTVLTTDRTGQFAPDEQIGGVHVHRVRAWPRRNDWFAAPGVYRYITRGRWDVIHVQGYHTLVAPLAMAAAARSDQPFVVTFHSGGHSSPLRRAIRPIQRALLRPLLRRAERLIGVSSVETRYFADRLRIPPERFATIPNGISIPVDGIRVESSDRLVICSVGRLERYKGHHRAIAALPYLRREIPHVLLRVVGAGPYEAKLRALTTELGVSDLVEFIAIPPTDRALLSATLKQAELILILSSYESHGMAALEAIALGRPVLVTDTSALAELAEAGYARTVPVRCPDDQLATMIRSALADPLVPDDADLPTWDSVSTDLLTLYRSVTER